MILNWWYLRFYRVFHILIDLIFSFLLNSQTLKPLELIFRPSHESPCSIYFFCKGLKKTINRIISFYNFLMMTTTLVRRSGPNVLRHFVVDPLFLFLLSLLKGRPVFTYELTVFYSLLELPFFAFSAISTFDNWLGWWFWGYLINHGS